MKKFPGLLCGLALAGIVPFCVAADDAAPAAGKTAAAANAPAPAEKAPALKTEKEIRSYAVGMSFGKNLKRSEPNLDMAAAIQGIKDGMVEGKSSYSAGMVIGRDIKRAEIDLDTEMMLRGIKDAASGGNTLLSDDEFQKAVMEVSHGLVRKQIEKNKKQGEDFLAANKKKEGVITLPSGLQYKVTKEGEGKVPTAADAVSVNYRGTLVDGTEIDNSYKRGKPETFPVSKIMKGWSEALQKMKVGSKWQLFIPAALAYGEQGYPPAIMPKSALIFEVELVGIEAPKAASPPAFGPK